MKYSTAVILRKDYIRKDGKASLQLRIIINGQSRKFPTDITVKPSEWDTKHNRIKTSVHNAIQMNILIDRIKARADEIIINMQLQGRQVDFASIHRELYGPGKTDDFISFYREYIDNNKVRWASETQKMYYTELTKLTKFRPVITFNDLKHELLLQYENYMVLTLNNKINTVAKTFKKMKPVISEAIRKGYIKDNPFRDYKVRNEPTKREFLTIEEVNALSDLLPFYDKKTNDVLVYFLFACYTGLRYQDVQALQWKNVSSDYLNLVMNKTGEQIMIPLTKQAKNLLNSPGDPNTHVFNVISNQKTNDYLKLAKVAAHINKPLSFHIARHTFATISLNIGIPIDVVSKLLGHNSLRTTQIYAKLLDTTKFEQMKKWDNLN